MEKETHELEMQKAVQSHDIELVKNVGDKIVSDLERFKERQRYYNTREAVAASIAIVKLTLLRLIQEGEND